MAKKTAKAKTEKTPQEILYALLKKSIGAKPIKMSALAAKCGLTEEGETVPSPVAARCRVQLKRLIADGFIVKNGGKATTTYNKKPKPKT